MVNEVVFVEEKKGMGDLARKRMAPFIPSFSLVNLSSV